MYIITEQIDDTELYMEYIKEYGKAAKTNDRDELANASGNRKNNGSKDGNNDYSVKAISILGERNSGTTWMYEHLNECFNQTIPIKRRLTRYKHWFQDENVGDPIIDGTLVISIFRNPFEWVEAMRKKPHHAPKHMFIKNWKEFVTKPWTMNRVGKDLEMSEEDKLNKDACQENFMFRDLISCHLHPYPKGTLNKTHYSEDKPFYEMKYDGSGEPFDNSLEMRAAKIRNFLSVSEYAGVIDSWILQYEVLVASGTIDLIKKIEGLTGATASCIPSPPQENRKKREIEANLMEYLKKNLDWEAENLVGYHKSGMRKPGTNSKEP
jgi:hypothetical protein